VTLYIETRECVYSIHGKTGSPLIITRLQGVSAAECNVGQLTVRRILEEHCRVAGRGGGLRR
jgi:hypothetical protein